jgi:FkbM family methyltransferase
MKKYITAFSLLFSNPLLLYRKIFTKLRKKPLVKKIRGINFMFDFSYDTAMGLMYSGVYEKDIVDAISGILKEGDAFIDVGANIGYISAIGLGKVGKTGEVHSFEPVPKYNSRLRWLAELNKAYKIRTNQCAVTENGGTVNIHVTNLPNIGWNTAVPGFMESETIGETVSVPAVRLDSYISEHKIKNIKLIKIDTEGYEFPVLKSLKNYFEATSERPGIICEISPGANRLLGYSLPHISGYMLGFGYKAFRLDRMDQEVDIPAIQKTTNVLFKAL